ncbi:hypothetical protein PGT21_011473 [Puccinia graminis f. sp. tritici]|uniref:Secreted protein n=1 Tax=Puccinia graminis f. sp. tritici TaxID=56615 RepID=A0A5B0LKR3_PUCGR|nr:hypothetical protein PGT21_011473 [Puccinia graminis f. sp. tritici]KAA1068138.1 hypothetical protein PGTUg99_020895 [Puccinia graminis f. sp. tritici]
MCQIMMKCLKLAILVAITGIRAQTIGVPPGNLLTTEHLPCDENRLRRFERCEVCNMTFNHQWVGNCIRSPHKCQQH